MTIASANERRTLVIAGLVGFIWGLAEATVFFVVPDVAIAWFALRRRSVAALACGLAAALGAMIGGIAVVLAAAADPEAVRALLLATPAISATMLAAADAAIAVNGWMQAALAGSVGGTPFKIFASLAERHGVGLVEVALLTPLLRLPRFLLVGAAFHRIGLILRRRDGRLPAWALLVFCLGWTLFYAAYWVLTPW